MLVEINLLPQREPRKFAFLLIVSSLAALILLVGIFYYFQINSTKGEMASVDRQISVTRKIVDKKNNDKAAVEASSSITQLKKAITWADEYPIKTIPVMNALSSLLPERGFIQNFSYTEAGTISIQVQFDSAREAAYFLNSLNDAVWIESASLNSLATSETQTNNSNGTAGGTGSAVSQATQAGSPTATTNTNGTTAPISNQSSTSNTPTAGSTTTSAATSNTTSTTTSPVANNATATTANATANSTANSAENNNILPRYTGQYEIVLNKEEVKKMIQKSKKDGGVSGS